MTKDKGQRTTAKQAKKDVPAGAARVAKAANYKWLWVAGILLLTFIAFYPSLKGEFTNWDDNVYINENTLLTHPSSHNLKDIFSTENPVSLNYHPLTILTLASDYKSVKLNPFRYHLVNLLLHLANTLLVFFFAFRLSKNNLFVAAFVAVFFGIHPMHVESVAWVAERKDVLYTLFFLAGLITYLRYEDSKKMVFIIFTFILFVLSVLSKAMAVVFPVVLLLLDYYKSRKITFRVIAEKIPFFIIAALAGWLALRIQSRSAIAAYSLFTLPQRISFGFYGFMTYIWKMILPVHLSAFYPYPVTDIYGRIPLSFYLIALAGLLLFAFVIILAFLKKDKVKPVTFGVLFFFTTMILVLQFISVGQVIMADRYSYIPYIGLLFAIGVWLQPFIQKHSSLKNPVTIGMLAIAIVFSFITHARAHVWKNSATLWTDVMKKYPFPPWTIEVAYENRGNYYAKEQYALTKDAALLDKGLVDYETLMRMNTRNYAIFKNLGNIYGLKAQEYAKAGDTMKAGHFTEKSIAAYDTAIALNNHDADLYVNLAITYMNANRPEPAAMNYHKALQLKPDYIGLYENEGLAYFNAGNIKAALEAFLLQAQQQPANSNPIFNIAVCYDHLGDKANALSYALKAKQMGHEVTDRYLQSLGKTTNHQ